MWKKFKSYNPSHAKELRSALALKLGATHVVDVDQKTTMAEWVIPTESSREQRQQIENKISYRIDTEVLSERQFLVNKNPVPLKPGEWRVAHCGIGVLNIKYPSHRSGCNGCTKSVSPRSVQQIAQDSVTHTANTINNINKNTPVKVTQNSSSPSSVVTSNTMLESRQNFLEARQNSIPIQGSDAVLGESPIEAINGTVIREPSVTKDRGEDFIHYTERKTQSFKELLTQFDDKLTKMFTTIDGLFEWHQQAQKWLDGIGDVETELKKIEQLQLEIERRRKIVRSNLDK